MITKVMLMVTLMNVNVWGGEGVEFVHQFERKMPTQESCILASKMIKEKYAKEYHIVRVACVKYKHISDIERKV
jgi:hypothetical protein